MSQNTYINKKKNLGKLKLKQWRTDRETDIILFLASSGHKPNERSLGKASGASATHRRYVVGRE